MIGHRKKEAIEGLAKNVRHALSFSMAPYDPQKAIELLGGVVKRNDAGHAGIDGLIIKGDKEPKFLVFVNPKNPERRERFTLAHELGHLFLHMGFIIAPEKWEAISEYSEAIHFRDASIKRVEEFEANEFAAAFLMPRLEFLDVVQRETKRGLCNTAPVADYFGVSEKAVEYRGKFLGVFQW